MKTQLPESLERQLHEFRKKIKTTESLTWLFIGLCLVPIPFFILFISDRIWDTPTIIRLVLCSSATIFLSTSIFQIAFRFFFASNSFTDLSIIIQNHHRKLGDSLLSAVELSGRESYQKDISEELIGAALKNIAEQSEKLDFNEAICRRGYRISSFLAVVILLILCATYFSLKPVFLNSLSRLLRPLTPIERYTFVRIEPLPDFIRVPHGEEISLKFKLMEDSILKPESIHVKCAFEQEKDVSFINGTASMTLNGQTKAAVLNLWSGDFRDKMRIIPLHRPILSDVKAKIQFPDYLGDKSSEMKIENGQVLVPEGGAYSIEGSVNRTLNKASLTHDGKSENIATEKNIFKTKPRKVLENESKSSITWKDLYDFEPLFPLEYTVEVIKDRSPRTEILKQHQEIVMLADEITNIAINAKDDYGISEIGIKIEVFTPANDKKPVLTQRESVRKGQKDQREIQDEFSFCPKYHDIPEGSTVKISSYAKDFFPGREESLSETKNIRIMSREEHMRHLKDKFEDNIAKLENLIWQEENLLDENIKLARLPEEQLKDNRSTDKINVQKAAENKNAQDLHNLNNENLQDIAEALKNKDFPDKSIKGLTQALDSATETATENMKNAAENLEKSASDLNSRTQDIAKAADEQGKAIENLKNAAAMMRESLDALRRNSLVDRLEKAAVKEKDIANQLDNISKEKQDSKNKQKSKEDIKKQIADQKSKQDKIRDETNKITNDLYKAFSDTKNQDYLETANMIENSKYDDKMDEVQKKMEKNELPQAKQKANEISDSLTKNAEKLKNAGKPDNLPESQKNENAEFLQKALDSLKIATKEQKIIEKTKNLENKKDSIPNYRKKVADLAKEQSELKEDATKLAAELGEKSEMGQAAKMASESMKKAATALSSSNTGEETLSLEQEALNEIFPLLDESKIADNPALAKSLTGMKRLSRMVVKGNGGGFEGDAFSDSENVKINSETYMRPDQKKKAQSVSEAQSPGIPEEYRDSIENYFEAVHKLGKDFHEKQ